MLNILKRYSCVSAKFLILFCFIYIASYFQENAFAGVIGTTSYKGKTYYVDVLGSGPSAVVWLRVRSNACSISDIRAMDLNIQIQNYNDAVRKICRVNSVYNDAKTIVGCGATAGTGLCLVASVPTGGTAAILCSATIYYTATKGLADCIDGIGGKIASYYGHAVEYHIARMHISASTGQLVPAIENAINAACDDVR